jgi:hypothetical protein
VDIDVGEPNGHPSIPMTAGASQQVHGTPAMTAMRSLLLFLGVACFGVALGMTGAFLVAGRAKMAPHLTRTGLLQVTAGMPANEVPGKIGYPIDVRISGSTAIAPIGRSDATWPGPYVWVYAQPGWLNYLEVNVVMIDGAVSSVNVEYDDARVYSTTHPSPAPAAPSLSSVLK